MKNVVDTLEYQSYRNEYNYVFSDEYLINVEMNTLSSDFSIKIYRYRDDSQIVLPYRVHCNLAHLVNKDSEIVYSIKNINNDAAFFNLIEHSNGKGYLIFRIDLYGYSVLDLDTMQDYHYIPEESFLGEETFIWTVTHYNKNTNLLVAEGCYWAHPSDIVLVDFSEPTILPFPEYDLSFLADGNDLEDIEFENWDGHDNIVIKAFCYSENTNIRKVVDTKLLSIKKVNRNN